MGAGGSRAAVEGGGAGGSRAAVEGGGAGGSRAAVEGGGAGGSRAAGEDGGAGGSRAAPPRPRAAVPAPKMALKVQLLTDASGAPAQMLSLDNRHLRVALDASEGAPVSACRFSVYYSLTCFTSTKVQILTRCSTRGGTHINLPPPPPPATATRPLQTLQILETGSNIRSVAAGRAPSALRVAPSALRVALNGPHALLLLFAQGMEVLQPHSEQVKQLPPH